MVDDMNDSLLAAVGSGVAFIFTPLGWGNWRSAVAAITGLVAKENVVATFGQLYGFAEVAENGTEVWGSLAGSMTAVAAYSFLVFNLLCAPCFAAMGAIKREMNNAKWFWFAIGYQTGLAYLVSLCVYQIQCKMVLVCNWISDRTCVSRFLVRIPDWHICNNRYVWNRNDCCNHHCDWIHLYAV